MRSRSKISVYIYLGNCACVAQIGIETYIFLPKNHQTTIYPNRQFILIGISVASSPKLVPLRSPPLLFLGLGLEASSHHLCPELEDES
jgi:hypothetical protein